MRLLGWGPTRPKYHWSIKINFTRHYYKTFLCGLRLIITHPESFGMKMLYFRGLFCNDILKHLSCTGYGIHYRIMAAHSTFLMLMGYPGWGCYGRVKVDIWRCMMLQVSQDRVTGWVFWIAGQAVKRSCTVCAPAWTYSLVSSLP